MQYLYRIKKIVAMGVTITPPHSTNNKNIDQKYYQESRGIGHPFLPPSPSPKLILNLNEGSTRVRTFGALK